MSLYEFPCGCRWPILQEATEPGAMPRLDFDVRQAPLDCRLTWDLLSRGETKGVFQLESPLGKQWCRKLKPEHIGHMGALGALLRPGCIKVKDAEGISTTQHYCRRKNGEEPLRGYHPAVDPILMPTYNVMVFQEQAMAIARAVAGFSLQDADVLRKAMGKKLAEEMAKVKTMFMEGAARTQVVSLEMAEELFGWIQESQRYSFNASHAISYGVMGYYSAYIKAHFPLSFFTAWLSNARENQDPKEEVYQLVQEARLFDIAVEIPDLSDLQPDFYPVGKSVVRFGLTSISGLGQARFEKTAAAVRELEQNFGCKLNQTSWLDFLAFVAPKMSSEVVRGLIYAGGLRWIDRGRRWMEAEYQSWGELSDKELEWVQNRLLVARGIKSFADVLPPPVGPTEPTPVFPSTKEYTKALTKYQKQKTKYDEELAVWTQKSEDFQAPLGSVADVLKSLARPKAEGGGCANAARIEKVLSQVQMLEHPPSSLEENPQWTAWAEEQVLGISLSCSELDSCDTSQVNCTCKDFLAGQTGFLMFGVKLESVRVVKTKKGKTAGSKMAFLSISDDTCMLDNVVCFPEKFKECAEHLVEKTLVILQGERAEKDDTLMVTKVWPCQQIAV